MSQSESQAKPDSNELLSDTSSTSSGYQDDQEDIDSTPDSVCLFCDASYPSSQELFTHCAETHDFDWNVVARGLDFYGRIKLVNYLRTLKAHGESYNARDRAFENDDGFLKPVLEGDALLFSLDSDDELEGGAIDGDEGKGKEEKRIKELEEMLADLKVQFAEYKQAVSKSFVKNLEDSATGLAAGKPNGGVRDDDSHYFDSYAGNDIHEIMLKDTVRTDAYRDFIYENKHLFKDKVVLDVGCGTGVLSMFCAKAGAKQIISVDNSAIIDKARANVYENGLGEVITCIQGKIEEVTLPVQQVDIIVSEWMGYCLLYEAMLDSVLFARDRYLAPDGLMVPSECKIFVAAVHDPGYMNDNVNFWNHIYGFSMTAMKGGIREDVTITPLPQESLASTPVVFCHLPLHSITMADLSFTSKFRLELKEDIDSLDAFCIYFDTFFTTSRDEVVSEDARAESWESSAGGVTFTTGPGGKETHWKQGLLLIDDDEQKKNSPAKKGDEIIGEITYRKREENSRELEIETLWSVGKVDGGRTNKQLWIMR